MENGIKKSQNPYFVATIWLSVITAATLVGVIVTLVNLVFLHNQNTELTDKLETARTSVQNLKTEVRQAENPVIGTGFSVIYTSDTLDDGRKVQIWVNDGEINYCSVVTADKNRTNCVIEGVADKIYKVADVRLGDEDEGYGIGLITQSGLVYSFKLLDLMNASSITVKSGLRFEQLITDILTVLPEGDTYNPSSLLMFANGTYQELTHEMVGW